MANFIRNILPKTRALIQMQNLRGFTRTAAKFESINSSSHKVNNLEKKFLVWTGKYKSTADVPTLVPAEVVEKARNRMRIRLANLMMVLTLVACLAVSISGKRAHQRGESVQKNNLAWHQQMKEEAEKKQEK